MVSLRSIEAKIDTLSDKANENNKNIAVIEEHLSNQNGIIEKTIRSCSLTRQNYSDRIKNLEKSDTRRSGIYTGIRLLLTSAMTSIITVATITKTLGLW